MDQLLAYVEYFWWLRFVTCLSTSYQCLSASIYRAVDPVLGKELDLDVDLASDTADVTDIFEQRKVDFTNAGRDLDVLAGAWREIDLGRARSHAIDDTLKSA